MISRRVRAAAISMALPEYCSRKPPILAEKDEGVPSLSFLALRITLVTNIKPLLVESQYLK